MRRTLPLLLVLLAGCVSTTGGVYVTPPESPIRSPLRSQVVKLLEKSLTRDGWVGWVVSSNGSSVLAAGAADGWQEDRILVDVAACTPAGEPIFIPMTDYPPILTALRKKLTTVVESLDGTVADYWSGEAHGERGLTFVYTQGTIQGTLVVRARPRTEDGADQMLTRFEITLREK